VRGFCRWVTAVFPRERKEDGNGNACLMKELVLVCLSVWSVSIYAAASRMSGRTGLADGMQSVESAQSPDCVQVKGTGVGTTEELALKDACRDAVESDVGMFVDAEQMVKNDELIKDEILTQSNAYIEGYDIIEKKSAGGIVKMKILARVRKQALTKKISGMMKPTTVKIGSGLKNLYAQVTTGVKKSADGAALLAKALEGVSMLKQLMEVSLATGEAVPIPKRHRLGESNAADDGMIEVAYLFKFEINREKYFNEFLPHLERVLTQISETEPRDVIINTRPSTNSRRHVVDLDRYLKLGSKGISSYELQYGQVGGTYQFASSVFGEVLGDGIIDDQITSLDVVLVTEANASMSSIRGKLFSLDSASAREVCAFNNLLRGDEIERYASNLKLPIYAVSFVDEGGKTFVSREIDICSSGSGGYARIKSILDCQKIVSGSMERGIKKTRLSDFWFITPFLGGNALTYYRWFSFNLPKDDLPKIDSIKIELVQ